MSLEIHPLSVGRVNGMQMPSVTYLRGWGEKYDTVFIMFVILGGPRPVIVDTGPPESETVLQYHGHRLLREPHEEPLAALASLGVDPAEVRTVINTHLHWDHSSSNHLFPNAEVIVQASELDYATEPVEWHNPMYEKVAGATAPWRKAEKQIRTIEGDAEVAEGISIVTLPGHTPGSQGVLVQGAEKRHLIAGDCVNAYVNWEGDGTVSHIPSGIFTDIIDYSDSFRKIEGLGCEVIPSHDKKVVAHGVFA